MNLEGRQLRYEIGASAEPVAPRAEDVIEVGYDVDEPPTPDAIAYVNSRDEKNSRRYGPYLAPDDIDRQYPPGEPRPNPSYPGFERNLTDQLYRRRKFGCVEIDNLDSWDLATCRRIYAITAGRDFRIITKNPMTLVRRHGPEAAFLVSHPGVIGAIVESECGTPDEMAELRRHGRETMPCWFVYYGTSRGEALEAAAQIRLGRHVNMGVTFSPGDEYGSSEDVLRPNEFDTKRRDAMPTNDDLQPLAEKLAAMFRRRNFKLRTGPGECNLGYLEGCDVRGRRVERRPDRWDDVRYVLQFRGGNPFIAGIWQATTRAGYYYDRDHVLPDARDKGCAYIDLGQQFCWQVGLHRGKYRALVQTGGACRITRDKNQDLLRTGDEITTGFYGINHHHGNDWDQSSIGPESAGCNVVRRVADHETFMRLVDADPGQQADRAMVWGSTVAPYDWLEESATPETARPSRAPPPVTTPAPRQGFFAMVPGGYYSDRPFDQSAGHVSVRMNNPGAVNGAKWEETYPGFVTTRETTPGNRTTVFQSPEHGVAVWWDLMRRYRKLGSTTVGGIISRYGGGQDYSAYLDQVTRWTGLRAEQEIEIDGSGDDRLLLFAKAMFRYEAGQWKPDVKFSVPWSDAQIMFGLRFGREFSSTGKPLTGPIAEKSSAAEGAGGAGAVIAGAGAASAASTHVSVWVVVGLVVGGLLLAAGLVAAIRSWRASRELGGVQTGGAK